MGSHRADQSAPRRRLDVPADSSPTTASYVGKRVAGRQAPAKAEPVAAPIVVERADAPVDIAPIAVPRRLAAQAPAAAPVPPVVVPTAALDRPTVELPALHEIPDFDPLTDSSSTTLRAIAPSGKRRAVKHVGRTRAPLFRGLPSMPVAVGVAALAVAIGGVVTSTDTQLTAAAPDQLRAANAMTGSQGMASYTAREGTVSRSSDRDALAQASGTDLVAQVEQQAEARNAKIDELARAAEKQSAEIALNRWVLPVDAGLYHLTSRFGECSGLWSHCHTGLDFAADPGTPIHAIANGVVTSTGYDGAYGNKTVITLEDGTEIWFCHQTSISVSPGDTVRGGEVIGTVGSTGNTTGPHVHLEVRPGGGDPVDPDAALRVHLVVP